MKRGGGVNLFAHFSQENMPKLHEYKIAIVGPEKCGKSNIVSRFLNGCLVEEYEHTIEDIHYQSCAVNINSVMPSITSDVNEIQCKLSIVDTSGQLSEFDKVNEGEMLNCHGFVMVADLSDTETLSKLQNFYMTIAHIKQDEIQGLTSCDQYAKLPMVVVGNKSDCKAINVEDDVLEWAESIGIQFVTLSKDDTVNSVFDSVVSQIVHNTFILPLISDTSVIPMSVSNSPRDNTKSEVKDNRKSFRKSLSAALSGFKLK